MNHHAILGTVLVFSAGAVAFGCGSGTDSSAGGNTPDLPGVEGGSSSGSSGSSGSSSGSSGSSSGSSGSSSGSSGSSSGSSGSSSGSSGSSGNTDAGGEFNTPPVCTSGTTYTSGNNADMKPGEACNTCHKVGGAASTKVFDIGGTVYPTAHEPDDCNGLAGVVVTITGKDGKAVTFTTTSSGNFSHNSLFGFAAIPTPYTAKVTRNGKDRVMVSAQTNGDCNSCHTQNGDQGAPGRILAP